MTPDAEWLAQWEADEAESARARTAELNRLQADLDAFPDSPTLNTLAHKDPTGRVIGTAFTTGSVLPMAWRNGAPAALVAEADRLTALLARDRPGYLRRAIRLAHRVRAVNARLRPFLDGRNALGTVTVRLPLNRPAVAPVAIPELPTTTGPVTLALVVDTDADPPPLDAPDLAPLLRTGPPASPVVRPRQAAPVLAARRSERWTVSRAA